FFFSLRRTFLAPTRLLGGICSLYSRGHRSGRAGGPARGLLLADLLLAGHGLLLALAGTRVGLRALTVHRKPAAVPDALVAPDLDLAADVGLHLAAQVSLGLVVRLDPVAELDQLFVAELVHPQVAADAGALEGLQRPRPADAEDVGESDLHALVAREVDAEEACHMGSSLHSAEVWTHRVRTHPARVAAPASGD